MTLRRVFYAGLLVNNEGTPDENIDGAYAYYILTGNWYHISGISMISTPESDIPAEVRLMNLLLGG